MHLVHINGWCFFSPLVSDPLDRLIWFRGSVLELSGFSPLPITVVANQTVVLPIKSNVNHH